MTLFALLAQLSDGKFHSGEELATQSNVSRTAIWKQLKKLDEFELELYSVRGKGYKLASPLELLDKEAILGGLSSDSSALLSDLEICLKINSTNSQALQRARGQSASGYVCLAEQQSQGRGRRGRQWVSPFGKNIYFSLLWRFSGGAPAMEGLSLAVGVVIAEVLSNMGVEGLQLKWPNDLLYQGKKLGGVLIEMEGDLAGHCQAVVGVGINVSMPATSGQQIDQEWTDIDSISPTPISRNKLASATLDALLLLLSSYEEKRFSAYQACWEKLDAYYGQRVQLTMGPNTVIGVAAGVDNKGSIRIKTETGIHPYNGGEISLRPINDS
jgi:BirA family biotin operon repressor/biotin-[acetyl-CoA-carboxylase] ligase